MGTSMQNFTQDIRFSVRSFLKNPGFTMVAVLTLALGIGANTAIFTVVQNVLLRPLPYPKPEQLVGIWNTYPPSVPRAALSPGDYDDWRREAKSFSEMGGYAEISKGVNLAGDGEPQRVLVGYASSSLFPMLGARAVAGRLFTPEEDRAGSAPVVVLSHRLWRSRFGGDPSVVGQSASLDNRRYTVAGVLPAGFELLRWADLWMPIGQYDDDLTEHVHHAFVAIGRLKAGVSIEQARDEITRLHQQEAVAYPDSQKGFGVLVDFLRDPAAARLRSTLLVLFGAVGLVLLIACANIVNLLLVRNASRQRELALRTALGADQWRLLRQLLTETLLLSICGGALGVLFGVVGLRALLAFVPASLEGFPEVSLNRSILGFTILICLGVGILCGLLPAFRALRTNLSAALKQGSKGSPDAGAHRAHRWLVVSEVALALVPLVGAGLLLRSLERLLRVDPGFRADHLLTMEIEQAAISFAEYNKLSQEQQIALGKQQAQKFELIAAAVQALPGVRSVGGIDDLPLGNELRQASRFVIEGRPPLVAGARPIAQVRSVSQGYFSALGVPLRAGRMLEPNDWNGFSALVINETMAHRFWPEGDALGKRVNFCSLDPKPCWFTVVGVVGDVHQFGLDAAATYDAYFPGGWTPYLVVRSASDPSTLASAIAEVVHKTDPSLPVAHVITMQGLLAESASPKRFSAVLIAIFAALALVLAAVGIYGVMSYTVSSRTQEIGIRMALGAQPREMQSMILGKSLRLTLMGIGLGLLGSLALMRFLSSMLFGVRSYDAITFCSVALLLILVALAASYLPARRAIHVDPLVALRDE